MIEYKNGRYRSTKSVKEAKATLVQSMESLSEDERAALQVILDQMGVDGKGSALLEQMSTLEYKSTPVDLRTFVYDPYYLGQTCDVLYPKIFEALQELFSNDYNTCVFTGSIGWGKSFGVSIGICYILYLISLLKNPQESFGLSSTSTIDIVVFSVTEDLAAKVAFDNIVSKLEVSQYFTEAFKLEINKREINFPNRIRVIPRATTSNSAVGLNVITAWIDEAEFIKNKKKKRTSDEQDMVDQIYALVVRRMKSRFLKKGKLPGLMFISSSKNVRNGFTERLLRKSAKDSSFFVRDWATWDVKDADTYMTDETFWVLVGNEAIPSRILKPGEYEVLKNTLPEDCIFLEVPEDFRSDFESDLDGSIRDQGGISTLAISPFISQRDSMTKCIQNHAEAYPGVQHPFSVESFTPGEPGQFYWTEMVDKVQEKGFLGHVEERYRPRIHPRAIRAAHIDPSLKGDATAFCVAHVSGWTDVRRRAADGNEYLERAPIYTVDFMLRIKPPTGGEIILGDVRQFIYDLSSHGYSIGTVTCDGYNSADTLQILAQKGYKTDLLSVDRTMEPYENLKTALYEGRVLMYRYEPLLEELRKLQKDLVRRKVDHPDEPGASKDVADALAGCLFSLSQISVRSPMPIMMANTNSDDAATFGYTEGVVRGGSDNRVEMWQDLMPPFLGGGMDDGGGGWNDM